MRFFVKFKEALERFAADWGLEVSDHSPQLNAIRLLDTQAEGGEILGRLDAHVMALYDLPTAEPVDPIARRANHWMNGIGAIGGLSGAIATILALLGLFPSYLPEYAGIPFAVVGAVLWTTGVVRQQSLRQRSIANLTGSAAQTTGGSKHPFGHENWPFAAAYAQRIAFWRQLQKAVLVGKLVPPSRGRHYLQRFNGDLPTERPRPPFLP